MTVEKRAEAKIDKLKETLNKMITETQSTKNELRSKQELINNVKSAFDSLPDKLADELSVTSFKIQYDKLITKK